MELSSLSIREIHRLITKKEISTQELVERYLKKIEKENPEINAFLEVFKEESIKQAQEIDRKIQKGEEISILEGIPVAIKDNILVADKRCTAGSKILENYIAPYDATVVRKLKEKGAIVVGKTNLDEFAIGSSGEFSAYGATRNPKNLEYVPGGSSSGSAAAVAANMVPVALGSDTGGSVRQPASFCGIIGFKPTYGLVSRFGLIAMSSSLDQIGPLGKNVEDVKIIYEAIKGEDEMDSTTVSFLQKQTKERLEEVKIGIPKEYFARGINPKVKEIIEDRIKDLELSGASIEEVSLPHTDYALATYYIVMTAEVSSNLARYDGIKYGKSLSGSDRVQNLLDVYLETRKEFLGEEVKRRIMLGTYCLSVGYYDAYYLQAQKVRTLIKEDFERAFQKVDFLLTPTSPTPPFKLGERLENPLTMYMADILTASVNLAGLPAISLSAGEVDKLPVGLQLIGPAFSENFLLSIAQLAQRIWT
ncbi:Asp-tRNA(Asn)/Glu-tRNA(Gln) amidotransferase subunit GatA [bacterium]|nr:Asp-tRNA(Asn)/Glu-tRNA(Gln) amidotransferase subunit GatA [bacterium]